MAKWKLPEGRKPITTMDSADLVLRMHDKLAAGTSGLEGVGREEKTDMNIETDTSPEAVERLAKDHDTVGNDPAKYVMGHPHHWKTAKVLRKLSARVEKSSELQGQMELVIPYLRDMQERGDDEAKFLLNMLGDNS